MKTGTKWLLAAAATCVGALLLCCVGAGGGLGWYFFAGESNRDVCVRYGPKFSEKREQVKRIASKLPPVGAITKPNGRKDINPAPAFDVTAKEMNCSLLMYDHLLDPDKEFSRTGEIEIILSESQLRYGLLWTGPKNPMAESSLRERRTELDKRLDAMLSQPYLVVVRKAAYMAPRRIVTGDIHAFVAWEVFLVRYEGIEILASFRVEADAKPFQQRLIEKEPERFIQSDMIQTSIDRIERLLNEETNGKFKLRR